MTIELTDEQIQAVVDEFSDALNFWAENFTVRATSQEYQDGDKWTVDIEAKATMDSGKTYEFTGVYAAGEVRVIYCDYTGDEAEVTPELLYLYLWDLERRGAG